jgi:1-acylglycerone phosphate reductase
MSNLSESGIETLVLDVTIPESISALKDEITKRTGGTLDILYNNAGSSKSFYYKPSSYLRPLFPVC